MKSLFAAIGFIILLFAKTDVTAQYCGGLSGPGICTANNAFNAEGFAPREDSLPCIVVGQPYSQVIQLHIADTAFVSGFHFTLYYVKLDTISNLPCGICWTMGDSSFKINGASTGCIKLSGTTFDAPGEYMLHIIGDASTSLIGLISNVNLVALGSSYRYYVRVILPGNPCVPVDTGATGNTASGSGSISTPTINGPAAICTGASSTLTVSGTGYSSYRWSTGDTTSYIQVSVAGTYAVTVYENCGWATASKTVTLNPVPSITLGPGPAFCVGSANVSQPYTATTGSPGQYNIVWNAAAISHGLYNIVSRSLAGSPIAIDVSGVTVAGTYSGALTVTNTTSGCTSNAVPISLTAEQLPSVPGAITGVSSVCQGQYGYLYRVPPAANDTGYLWTVPPGITIIEGVNLSTIYVSFSNTASSGNFTVSGTNHCGTGPAAILPVTVFPTPVVSSYTSANPVSCYSMDGSITLSGLSPFTTYLVSYSKNGATPDSVNLTSGFLGDLTISSLGTGVYSNITITLGSCPLYVGQVSLYGSGLNVSVLNNSPTCKGGTLNLTATPTGGFKPYGYAWSTPDSVNIGTSASPSRSNFSISMAGSYTVTVTDSVGCTVSATSWAYLDQIPGLNGYPNSICRGSNANLNVYNIFGGGTLFNWAGPGLNTISAAPYLQVNSPPVGNDTYTVTFISGRGCRDTASTTIVVNPIPPAPTLTVSGTGCLGFDSLTVTGADSAQLINWSFNGSFITPTAFQPYIVAGGNGSGNAANQLAGAASVFSDSTGTIYVSDGYNDRIQAFPPGSDSTTNGVTVAGVTDSMGSTAYELNYPSWVVLDATGNIYVADQNNQRIQKFPQGSASGTNGLTVAGITDSFGFASNVFQSPNAACIDNAGNIYVADYGNSRIQKFALGSVSGSTGYTVAGGTGYGNAANKLSYPSCVFVDGAGYIYVADMNNNRIQKFPPNSDSLTNGVTVAGNNRYGSALNQLSSPEGIFVDAYGNLYVADYGNARILKFPSGSDSSTLGQIVAGGYNGGSGSRQLTSPTSVFVDKRGDIFVTDFYNYRVVKWPAGAFSRTFKPAWAGNYSVTYTAPSGCVSWLSDSVTIQGPQSLPGGPDSLCQSSNPGSISLSGATLAGGASLGAWSVISGGGTLSDTTFTANPAAITYTPAANYSGTVNLLYITNTSGCANAFRTVQIIPSPVAAIIANPDTICFGLSSRLSVPPAYGYSWSGPGFSSGSSNPLVTPPVAGNATYSVTVTNYFGCRAASSVNITVSDTAQAAGSIVFTSPDSTICPGTQIILNVSGGNLGGAAEHWTWYKNDTLPANLRSSANTLVDSPTVGTTYYVRAEGLCNTTISTSLVVRAYGGAGARAADSISALPDAICAGGQVILTVDSGTGTAGTYPGHNWLWYSDAGLTNLIGAGPVSIQYPVASTTYYVRPWSWCSAKPAVSKAIAVSPPLSVQLAKVDSFCYGAADTIYVSSFSGGPGTSSFTWQVASDSLGPWTTVDSLDAAPYYAISGLAQAGQYYYQVTISSPAGCASVLSGVSTVNFFTRPYFSLNIKPVSSFTPPNGSVQVIIPGGKTAWYLWNTGDTTSAISGVPVGQYIVTVTEGGSCTGVDTANVVFAVGISALNAGDWVKIYPNPAQNILFVNSGNIPALDIVITDLEGRAVKKLALQGNQEKTIDIAGLAGGEYTIAISDRQSGETKYTRFTKL